MKHIVLRGHTRPLSEIGFVEENGERTLLFSSAHDKTPQVRNGETGDWMGTFHGHKGAVFSIKIDAATRSLAATASGDFSAKLWCAHTGKELFQFQHKHVVKTIGFSLDTLKIATGCNDGYVRIFDTCQPSQSAVAFQIVTNSATDGVTKLSWSTVDSNLLVLGRRAGTIEKWDIRQGPEAGPVLKYALPTQWPVMDFEANDKHDLLLIAADNKVHTLSLSTFEEARSAVEIPTSSNAFHNEGGVSLSPDGKTFFAGGADLWLREFDAESGQLLRTLKGHHGPVRCVKFHPSGKTLASGSEDGTIRLWDLQYSAAAAAVPAEVVAKE
eukprot:gene2297-2516_t